MHPSAAHAYNLEESVHLSNEAVQLLLSIVRRAQEHIDVGTRTFDALFAAYEAVFAENGLDTNRDRICFRFLLRLGQPDRTGQGLYENFEQLLAEQNIVLEYEDDSSKSNDVDEIRSDSGADILQEELENNVREIVPSRRASFTSVYDATKELVRAPARRRSSRSSVSRLGLEGSRARTSTDPHGRSESKSVPQNSQQNSAIPGSSHGLGRRLEGGPVQKWAKRPASPLKDQSVLRHTLKSRSNANPARDDLDLPETRLSKSEMINAARTFDEMRLQGLLKHALCQWREETQNVRSHNDEMKQQALAKDRQTLLWQAFDIWRTTTQELRKKAETEERFKRLYSRAGKARDLYLMAKAFSHWRILSAEESARTSVAHRHMLRMKYFKAWKDITVINELKAQRQGLKRPFNLLRKRFAEICTNEVNAISLYHHNLTKLVFFRWFWAFCEAAVPRYRLSQVRTRTFHTWVEKNKQRAQQERQADSFFIRQSLQKSVTKWATAARIDIAGYHQADAFRINHLKPLLQQWRAEAKLQPLVVSVSNMRDWRIARNNFSHWVMRNRLTHRAVEVERLRSKRNAWTAWNDQLRIRALQSQIETRIVAQTVYKWLLRERSILMTRVHQQKVKQRVFSAFLGNARAKAKALAQPESIFEQNQRTRTLSSALECWELQMKLMREKKIMAREFWAPRLQQDALSAWRSEMSTQRKHGNWAVDAYFYFSTTRAIQRWRAATHEVQKKRRQVAYAAVRKLVKVNLAKKLVSKWHDKLQLLGSLQREAQRVVDSRFREEISLVFGLWKATANQRVEDYVQASTIHSNRLLRGPVATWQDKAREIRILDGRAQHFRYIHISEICSAQLRKFSLKAFEIRCREQAADAAKERQFDKHLRQMIRHWNEHARAKLFEDVTEPTAAFDGAFSEDAPQEQPSALDRPAYLTRSEMNIRQAEEWTAFDEILDYGSNNNNNEEDWIPPLNEPQATTSTPAATVTPGYLNTPSKRAVRARALANLSTTPAGTPTIRTPFTARLRGERDVSRTPGTIGRDRSVRRVTFEDLDR